MRTGRLTSLLNLVALSEAWSYYLYVGEEGLPIVPTDLLPLFAGTDNSLLDCVQVCKFYFVFWMSLEPEPQMLRLSGAHLLLVPHSARCRKILS